MERRKKIKRSKMMKMIESQYKENLETLLPRMYNIYDGLPGMVEHMNLNKSTIHYWMRTFGIAIESRAYAPGENTTEDRINEYESRIQYLELREEILKHSLQETNDENKRLKEELEFANRSSGPVY